MDLKQCPPQAGAGSGRPCCLLPWDSRVLCQGTRKGWLAGDSLRGEAHSSSPVRAGLVTPGEGGFLHY